MKSCLKIENCAACHVHSQGLYYVTCEFTWNDLRKLIEHQRAPAARFNNISLKLFGRHATYKSTSRVS